MSICVTVDAVDSVAIDDASVNKVMNDPLLCFPHRATRMK